MKKNFIRLDEEEKKILVPGSSVKFIHSEKMTQAFWEFEANVEIPEHSHSHEQISNVLEGKFELTVDGETFLLEPGVVIIIPSNAVHSGRSITRCRILDVFNPVRDDYRFIKS